MELDELVKELDNKLKVTRKEIKDAIMYIIYKNNIRFTYSKI